MCTGHLDPLTPSLISLAWFTLTFGCAMPKLSNNSGCFRGNSITCNRQTCETQAHKFKH